MAPWHARFDVAVAAVSTYLVLRWLQSPLWGLLAGLLLAFHPLVLEYAQQHQLALRASALELAALASIAFSCRLAFRPRFAWNSWLGVFFVLTTANALAWATLPQAGLTAALVEGVGLLAAVVAALGRRRRQVPPLPARRNLTSAAALGLLVPVFGLLLAPCAAWLLRWLGAKGISTSADGLDLLWIAIQPDSPWPGWQFASGDNLRRWCWPTPWVVLPLMAWGWWRTVRRGWKQLRSSKPPLAWLLTLFSVVTLIQVVLLPPHAFEPVLLTLASLGALLGMFCIADVMRGLTDRLVLAPPAAP
jgi:hypothetical protein